jgi:hypothetical protein
LLTNGRLGIALPTVTYNVSDFAGLNNAVARADDGSGARRTIACSHQDRIHVGGGAIAPTHSRPLTGDVIRSC